MVIYLSSHSATCDFKSLISRFKRSISELLLERSSNLIFQYVTFSSKSFETFSSYSNLSFMMRYSFFQCFFLAFWIFHLSSQSSFSFFK